MDASIFGGFLVGYLIINGLLALIPAFVATQRGRSFGAFWVLGFFFTVVIALLVVIALPMGENGGKVREVLATDSDGEINSQLTYLPEFVKCPDCAEDVRSEAKVCRFCGKNLEKHLTNLKSLIEANVKRIEAEVAAAEHSKAKADAELAAAIIDKKQKRKAFLRSKPFLAGVITLLLVSATTLAISWPTINASIEAEKKHRAEMKPIINIFSGCLGVDPVLELSESTGKYKSSSYWEKTKNSSPKYEAQRESCVLKALIRNSYLPQADLILDEVLAFQPIEKSYDLKHLRVEFRVDYVSRGEFNLQETYEILD